jgi:hypothetical protein
MSLYLKTVARILRSAAGWMLRSRFEICSTETQTIDTQYAEFVQRSILICIADAFTLFIYRKIPAAVSIQLKKTLDTVKK